ncbi:MULTISPECIES: RecX family transcriptional regulator [unclassified Sporolactobacillus]|uniref:RecX family transcriptional regulator n=1 Tax=unclassified Sporolactobacillus TaxID=2628533 RepID=UPI002367A0C3|nr:RecX family transcriptional regulator [Sporolactobacillus sp. CQH2019]MDD9150388.1 RecX family transcriptional regulator [Sporolactobacillus sp. CQH2019]
MPVIARISTDGKNDGFFEIDIQLDDGRTETLHVHEDILVQDELRKGLHLTEHRLAVLHFEAEGIKAYLAGIRYLSYRMRSSHEMKAYLEKKGYSKSQIEYALGRLQKEQKLDDRAFAVAFTRTRIELSTKGPQLIYRELLQAGIAQSIAAGAESLYPMEEQLAHARKYLAKKTASVKNTKSSAEAKQILSRLLMQRGYSREITDQVIGEIGGFLADNEKNALACQAEKAMQKYKKYSGNEFLQKVKAFLYRKGFPADDITSFLQKRININN